MLCMAHSILSILFYMNENLWNMWNIKVQIRSRKHWSIPLVLPFICRNIWSSYRLIRSVMNFIHRIKPQRLKLQLMCLNSQTHISSIFSILYISKMDNANFVSKLFDKKKWFLTLQISQLVWLLNNIRTLFPQANSWECILSTSVLDTLRQCSSKVLCSYRFLL